MIGQADNQDVKRKTTAILRILHDSREPLGGRVIARQLNDMGIELGERAVRYHLKIMDAQGLTRTEGKRDGRLITPRGVEELNSALVTDRIGSVAAKIEQLAYQVSFDLKKRCGDIPINISILNRKSLGPALDAMSAVFHAGICVSDLVSIAFEGEELGGQIIPSCMVGLATVSSVAVSGAILKAGIPLDTRFGGILQTRDRQPVRFIELIEYSGCSVNPAEILIASKMTSVGAAARQGEGKIVANMIEIPVICRPAALTILTELTNAGFTGVIGMGKANEPLYEIPAETNKLGIVLQCGLNPVAAAVEANIEIENHAMSGLIDYNRLVKFEEVVHKFVS
jgi:HTH-type transcriptional regulator, global nitrogen regulator NrpRI